MADSDFNMSEYITESMKELEIATRSHVLNWGMDRVVKWGANHQEGTILFSLDNDALVQVSMQFVGLWSAHTHLFQWGWDNATALPPSLQAVNNLRRFGQDHSYPPFITPKFKCEEKQVWMFAAAVMRYNQLQGAWRLPLDKDLFAYIVFDKVTVVKAASTEKTDEKVDEKTVSVPEDIIPSSPSEETPQQEDSIAFPVETESVTEEQTVTESSESSASREPDVLLPDLTADISVDLSGTLLPLLKKQKGIKRVWLVPVVQGCEKHCLLVVEGTAEQCELLTLRLKELEMAEMPEVVPCLEEYAELVRELKPFYRKKLFGIF